MTTPQIVGAIISFVFAGILAVLSCRSFKEKGVLLNNAYLYATEEERRTMNKKPHFRQSAICFALLCAACLLFGFFTLFESKVFLLLEIPVLAGALIYAIVSSIMIQKQED